LRRRRQGKVVSGLAGGIADVLEIDPVFVRAAFVALAAAGGIGILAYLVGWVLTLDEPEPEDVAALADRFAARLPRQRLALAIMVLGLLILLRSFGLWFGDSFVWPVALIAFGFALTWSRVDPSHRSRFAWRPSDGEAPDWRGWAARLMIGGVLMTAGIGMYLRSIDAMNLVGNVVLAVGLTVVGFLLIFGPWVWRLVAQLGSERSERIRSEERADMAAHLHDSVLQTLALMQRSEDPKRMAMLARQQERELRSWLYGPPPLTDGATLRGELEAAAVRVEEAHQVPIEVVGVGDVTVDESLMALVAAAGEAMTNAARHSGAEMVSVFAEVDDDAVDVFVSDLGKGFHLDNISADRRGIAESIFGRLERAGGRAEINSEPGEGTEVHLSVRRS
jgi:signal transduction histidine kinase